MSNLAIEFFWDPASPYTYLASTQIEALAARVGAAVEWRPFLLGAAFQATGNQPPLKTPAKFKHLLTDVEQWARHYRVPLGFPKIFPINSVLALRVACAAGGDSAGYARAVMKAYWGEGADISQPAVVVEIANAVGLDGAALVAQAQEAVVKDRLRANTEEAVRRGAFGAPTFFVDSQMFWGNDRLVLMEEFIAGRLAA